MADRSAHGREGAFWSSDAGIDGESPVEIGELDLIAVDPLSSSMSQDMADLAEA